MIKALSSDTTVIFNRKYQDLWIEINRNADEKRGHKLDSIYELLKPFNDCRILINLETIS